MRVELTRMGLVRFIKEAQRAPSPLLPCEVIAKKLAISEGGRSLLPDTESAPHQMPLTWDFPASRSMRNKFLWFTSPRTMVLYYSRPQWTNTSSSLKETTPTSSRKQCLLSRQTLLFADTLQFDLFHVRA